MIKQKFTFIGFGLIFLFLFLQNVFSGRLVLPQTFNIGPIPIHYYGIIMALAIGSAFYLAIKRAARFGIERNQAEDILFWLIIGGFLGARLYHVFSSYSYYYSHPLEIFMVWHGGLSIYGAVLGGLLTFWIYRRLVTCHLSLVTCLDWLAPSVLLGQIIGRFGNLFNYEAFGYPTNLSWKMFVPENFRPLEYIDQAYFHPFFLYEVLGNLVILLLIIKFIEPKKLKPGQLGLLYLLLYNILRFGLEFLRIDSTFIQGFRLNAVVSLAISATACLFIYLNVRPRKTS